MTGVSFMNFGHCMDVVSGNVQEFEAKVLRHRWVLECKHYLHFHNRGEAKYHNDDGNHNQNTENSNGYDYNNSNDTGTDIVRNSS